MVAILVFCAILLVYCVFHLYFENFQKRLLGSGLMGQTFMWLHFPLHLAIAFLFEGVKGVLRFSVSHFSFSSFSFIFD
jgi:hypothetical protein